MKKLTRRQFLASLGTAAAAAVVESHLRPFRNLAGAQTLQTHHVYVGRNGGPVPNVQAVLDLAGGVAGIFDQDDVVVLKPNGQWPKQGYTHTLCMKALIDAILDRPGGFSGEIIIAEHIHRAPSDAVTSSNYCWNVSVENRANNWPDMSYLELEADYHANGHPNVTAIPMYDVSQDGDHWMAVSGPGDVSAGMHGWVRLAGYTAANGRSITPSYPIFRSAYSNKLIDVSAAGGVWEDGSYNGQQVKLIFLPTLNNHGSGSEDYAGITSAVKCHIGFQEGTSLHNVGYNSDDPDAVGESVGHLITEVFSPAFYMTCAEYSGHVSRTGGATLTNTVGLCTDPVTLDYWMSKYVLYPCNSADYFNPDNDNHTRQTLLGCNSKGVGTLNETEMSVHIRDANVELDQHVYLPLITR